MKPHTSKPACAPASAWEAAKAHGIDVSLLLANLHRTPEERIRDHDRALTLALAFRKAGEAQRG